MQQAMSAEDCPDLARQLLRTGRRGIERDRSKRHPQQSALPRRRLMRALGSLSASPRICSAQTQTNARRSALPTPPGGPAGRPCSRCLSCARPGGPVQPPSTPPICCRAWRVQQWGAAPGAHTAATAAATPAAPPPRSIIQRGHRRRQRAGWRRQALAPHHLQQGGLLPVRWPEGEGERSGVSTVRCRSCCGTLRQLHDHR